MLLTVVATVSNAKDNTTISGYLLNSKGATIEIYQNGKLIKTKRPIFKSYRLKFKTGAYVVVFNDGVTQKKMYVTLNKSKQNVQIDVDFTRFTDVVIKSKGDDLYYKKINQKENFEI